MMLDGDRERDSDRRVGSAWGKEGRGQLGSILASGCHLYVSVRVRLSVKIKRRTHGPGRQDSRARDGTEEKREGEAGKRARARPNVAKLKNQQY